MVTPLKQWSESDMRGVIRCLHAKGSPPKFHNEIVFRLWYECHEQKISGADRVAR